MMAGPTPPTLQAAIKAVIANDAWHHGTSPNDAAAILRAEAVVLEQESRARQRRGDHG